jgi:hypothetical protein
LASLMKNQGTLVALELARHKADELKGLLTRLGFSCATALHMDAAKAVRKEPSALSPKAEGAAENAEERANGFVKDSPISPPPAPPAALADSDPSAALLQAKGAQRKARVEAAKAKGKGLKRIEAPREAATGVAAAYTSDEALAETNGSRSLESARSTAFDAESFDAILLDPPCSALGLRSRDANR